MKPTPPRRHPVTGKPMEATKPTPPAHRDREYLQHVRSHRCKRCGRSDGVQAAHCGGLKYGKGWSRKVSDLRCIPLCLACHADFDSNQWLPDRWELEGWIARLLFEYVGITEIDLRPEPPCVPEDGDEDA